MASCPGCGHHLRPWDIKAECPKCGVNIPNYNWEVRLQEDAERSDRTFAKFRRSTANLKKGLAGFKLAIVRLVFTFVPLITLVLPIFRLTADFPFYSLNNKPFSLVTLITAVVNGFDISSFFALFKSELFGKGFMLFTAGIATMLLGILAAVVNFFALVIGSVKLNYKVNYICCLLSFLCYAVSFGLIFGAFLALPAFDDFPLFGEVKYGLIIGMALFVVNFILNRETSKQLHKMNP